MVKVVLLSVLIWVLGLPSIYSANGRDISPTPYSIQLHLSHVNLNSRTLTTQVDLSFSILTIRKHFDGPSTHTLQIGLPTRISLPLLSCQYETTPECTYNSFPHRFHGPLTRPSATLSASKLQSLASFVQKGMLEGLGHLPIPLLS